jgi:hypothetical protein
MLIRSVMAAALVASASSASAAAPVRTPSLAPVAQQASDKPATSRMGGGVAHGGLYAAALLASIAVFVGVTASKSDKADSD